MNRNPFAPAVLAALSALAFAAAHAQTADATAANRQAEAAFRAADTNQDGKLSRDEAAALPALAARFTEVDADKDGFISMAEFNKVPPK